MLAATGKRSSCYYKIHSQITLASSWQYMSHLVLHGHGGHSKDGPADNEDKLTYGGSSNQRVTL